MCPSLTLQLWTCWQFLHVNHTHALVEGVTKTIDSLLVIATDTKKCITIFSENLQDRMCMEILVRVRFCHHSRVGTMQLCMQLLLFTQNPHLVIRGTLSATSGL